MCTQIYGLHQSLPLKTSDNISLMEVIVLPFCLKKSFPFIVKSWSHSHSEAMIKKGRNKSLIEEKLLVFLMIHT